MSSKIQLKQLIIIAVTMTFLFSLGSSLWASYQWNVKMLEEKALETNRIYAQKLAQVVDLYLADTFQLLKYSAEDFALSLNDEEQLQKYTESLLKKDATFNSVSVINTNGELLAGSPRKLLYLKGQQLNFASEGIKTIQQTTPYISKPHMSPSGQEVIMISYPLFSKQGLHVGVLVVTIYIRDQHNVFHNILGEHYYQDGSYVFVVDSDGLIIYHVNPQRLDDIVTENYAVQQVMEGKSGANLITNTKGIEMLAGYSTSSLASWGIISQTPLDVAIAPAWEYVFQMFLYELPLLALALIIILIFAVKIAKPLKNLAKISEDSVDQNELKQLDELKTWYYEASQIKQALITSFSFLHSQVNYFMDQSNIDELTMLANRRMLNDTLEKWSKNNRTFVIVMIDLDHFKAVNDTYGHSVGDEVLKFFAREMQIETRIQDICCRLGGEEFAILFPETTIDEAYQIVNQLRQKVERTISPCGTSITFSAGISSFGMTNNVAKLLELADQALYMAKRNGRNQVKVIIKDG